MLNQTKKLFPLYPMLFFFVIYFISCLLQNDLWGNILSPIVAFLSSILIFISIKDIKNYKSNAVLLFLSCFIWGTADLLWLIFDELMLINPEKIPLINGLYVLPNIFFSILLTIYIYKNHENWNTYQLFIDIFAFCALGAVLLWTFIFSKTNYTFVLNFDYILTMLYILLDFYVMVEIGLIIFSKNFHIGRNFLLIFLGIYIYALTDFYYAYLTLNNAYQANSLVDIIYMLCNVLFSLGIVYEVSHPSTYKKKSADELCENLKKPKKFIFLIIFIFYLLYYFGVFDLTTLINGSIICIFYWVLSMNIRANMLDRLMLKTEKEMNEHLEKLIDKRTQELNLANRHLEEISNTDALTGLFNRRYFIQYLESLIHSDKVNSFALLYIDTNRFKPINDSYGHEIGDKVLHELGLRFSACNVFECTSFRIGGDEFAVIIENYSTVSEITIIVHQVFEILQRPISVPPYSFTLTASIGIARYPMDAEEKDILIRYADIAMYEVKSKSYKNNYMFFDKSFIEKINKKYEIEVLLQNADYDREFMLYYQPQYSTDTQDLIGMEALIRWKQPQNGLISPAEFIPIAEETGLIIQIGEWVVKKAFSQIKKWNEMNSLDLKMSINISPIQIKNTDFADWLWKKMQNEKIKPEWIDLEITESVAMISTSSIEKVFDFLNDIGVSISIDDFGTGYSSLSYIRKYNINRLKIAKELIDHIAYDENALLIVQTIIMMSRGMNLKTISEGVEDMEQLEILKTLGCDEIQGYIFGKPVPSDEFEELHLR